MEKLNVLIIDCSPVFSEKMKEILDVDEWINKVWATSDLTEGISFMSKYPVNMVILDVMYPGNESATALQLILSHKVLPVIVAAEASVDQTAQTVAAMSNGAIDFIKKADLEQEDELAKFEAELVLKMQSVTNANRLRSIARKIKDNPLTERIGERQPLQQKEKVPKLRSKKEIIVVIGTSTGGPRALHQLIQQIPKDFKEPILIVQHMPAGFTRSLAERLDSIGSIHVKEAVHGEMIHQGTAYIAPGNYHMEAIRSETGLKIKLSQGHEYLLHRPSVDILFKSVAMLSEHHKVAAILTGMGRDGTEGTAEIKKHENDAVILAESKETAVIDGMPKSIIDKKLVTQVLRIDEMGSAIAAYSKKRGN